MADFTDLHVQDIQGSHSRNRSKGVTLLFTDRTSNIVKRLIKPIKKNIAYGSEVTFDVMHEKGENTYWADMNTVDNTTVKDLMGTGKTPWFHLISSWGYHQYELDAAGDTKSHGDRMQFYKTMKMRAKGEDANFIEQLEAAFWNSPAVANTKQMFGMGYWVPKQTGTPSFQGDIPVNPSGHSTTVANISTVDYPRWQAWAGAYASVTQADLIDKITNAILETKFEAPIDIPSNENPSTRMIYVNKTTLLALETIAQSRNDNFKGELQYDGSLTVRSIPVERVPYFDENAGDSSKAGYGSPVWGIDWGTIELQTRAGKWMKSSNAVAVPDMHNMKRFFSDTTLSLVCIDRRKNWVLSTAA